MVSAMVASGAGLAAWSAACQPGSDSTVAMMLSMVQTAATGCLPEALSAESMTAPAPS
jgi:hypothetical protein